MLIIVEGVDGSGKSTLIQQLKQKLKCTEIACVPRNYPINYKITEELYKACSNSTNVYIMDRCFLSEWIYRVIKQDSYPNIIFQQIAELLTIPVVYIYCKNANAFDKSMERGETYVTSKVEHEQLSNAYDFVFETMSMFNNSYVYKYDYDYDNFDDLLHSLEIDWEVTLK